MPTSEKLTNKQRRAGIAYAGRVSSLASEAPDISSRRMLNKVAHAIRKRYGYSDEEKESEILRFVKNGAATITELVDEVGFPDREISKIVGELTIKNLVRVEKFRIGRRGRPSLLIFAID